MKKEYQPILRKLLDFDKNIVIYLAYPILQEKKQFVSFKTFSNFLFDKEDTNFETELNDFLEVNQYRSDINSESKDVLDYLHYDFEKMFIEIKKNLDNFDDYQSRVKSDFDLISKKIIKSGGFFGNPLDPQDIKEFGNLLKQFEAIRTIIISYLAIACIIKKSFYYFPWETTTQILSSTGIEIGNPPNVIESIKYIKQFNDFQFYTDQ